ncbi:DNA replication complex GINS protein psf1 [Smittium culicis]|uniref:DNA replication complex GINS protein PSF1 n=1 Tax=Smittium culicis TaxID=133412 RepID=A0A1R1X5S4_9FUNG|nr:DNA replication complex GINS protein psf1 [Smittium culicis]
MLGDEAYQLALEAKRTEADNLPPYNNKQVALVVRQTRQLWESVEKIAKSIEHSQKNPDSKSFDLPISNLDFTSNSQDLSSNISSSQYSSAKIDSQSQNSSLLTDTQKQANLDSQPLMSQLILQHLTVYRNKRILMAYHHRRSEALKRIAWALNLNPHLLSTINNINNSEKNLDLDSEKSHRKKIESTSDSISSFEKQFIIDYTTTVKKYRNSVEASLSLDTDLDFGSKLTKPPRDLFIEVRVIRECGEIQTEFGIVNLERGSQHFLRRTDVENLINLGYLQHIA